MLTAGPLRRHLVRTVHLPPLHCGAAPLYGHRPMCNAYAMQLCACMHMVGACLATTITIPNHKNARQRNGPRAMCMGAPQGVHNATITPPTTNTCQIANAAQPCKQKCCMLTNHPPPWHSARSMSRTPFCRICPQILSSQTSL